MNFRFISLIGSLVISNGSPGATWSLSVTNPASSMRESASIEVLVPESPPQRFDQHIRRMGDEIAFVVRKFGETTPIVHQVLTTNPGDNGAKILFQDSFEPFGTNEYVIESFTNQSPPMSSRQKPPFLSPIKRTFGRFVPERLDDFAWENDKVAFRMYGPALASQNGGSGLDCWLKRVSYPIINKWYELHLKGISYHIDRGEGYDPYHVGQSRGCGGLSYVIGEKTFSSSVFKTFQILDPGPIRTTFQLFYETMFENTKIEETKTISIDLGSHLTKFHSSITENSKPASIQVSIGLNTHENNGKDYLFPDSGIMSVWERFDDSFLATGIITNPNEVEKMYTFSSTIKDQAHAITVLRNRRPGHFEYFAGYGWVKAGTIDSPDQWHKILAQFQLDRAQPLLWTIRQLN